MIFLFNIWLKFQIQNLKDCMVSQSKFLKKMLEILQKADIEKRKNGGKPSKTTLIQQLTMTLEYLREYRTFFIFLRVII